MKLSRIAFALLCSIGFVMILIFLFDARPTNANSSPAEKSLIPDGGKIEPQVLDEIAAHGRSDFIVRFTDQVNLSPAYSMDWDARGEFVYKALTEAANRSQANAKGLLKANGIKFKTFIAGNDLYIKGGTLAHANALAKMPEVASVHLPRTYYINPIIENRPFDSPTLAGDILSASSFTTLRASIDATLDWGLINTKADQFWLSFGQGDGIVVANIDTGVQWDHPALDQSYKCAANPSDPACWADPSNICGGAPCDNNGHGTHTMGTMVGANDPGLTYIVGMAPAAQWIACKGCESTNCSEFALNTCADWILAPNGDPGNRPNVVNNSWGGGNGDPWYQVKVQAWVAAGIFPAFAAGNTGSSCGTINSPGDYQESFATAAHDSAGTIASFSSRGPSTYGHDPYTKPNLSAPGVNICSAVPTNAWNCGYSGTSMASPHTAGAVALLLSCNPGLIGKVDRTFQILQASAATPPAGSCSAPPDGYGNYTYGYGYLDVLNAGLAACHPEFGSLDGYVYDNEHNPLTGAVVTANLNPYGYHKNATTDLTGYYTMTLTAGSYDVTADKAGFTSETVKDVLIETGVNITQDFHLTPNGWAYGYVTDDDTDLPVSMVAITADDGSFTTTDDSGYYLLSLNPAGYTLTVSAPGYTPVSATVSITSQVGSHQDFVIQAKVKFIPSPIDISIGMGQTASHPTSVINHQTSDYDFEFVEKEQGYVPMGLEAIELNIMPGPAVAPANSVLADLEHQPRPASTISIQPRISAYQPNVLLLHADDDTTSDSPIQQMLLAYGDLGAVDLFDAGSATPTVAQLELYQVVVVWSNYAFADPIAIGNVLADYVDAGGKVIDLMFALYPGGGYEGRFLTDGYSAMLIGGFAWPFSTCMGIYDQDHPIMAGVTNVCETFRGSDSSLTPGSYEVARWQDNELFVAVKENGSVATINAYVGASYLWTGQMADVLHNAINYLPVETDVTWLSEVPISGTVPTESSFPVSIIFDASPDAGIIQPGKYKATLTVNGEIGQPDVNVPITMTVSPPSSYGKLEGTVIGLGHCDSNPSPIQGAVVAVEGGPTVMTDNNGDYLLWLAAGDYSITVTADGHIGDVASVGILPLGQSTVQDFGLDLDQPCPTVDPTMIEDTLLVGDVSTHTLHIDNGGSGALEYDFETFLKPPQLLLHLDDPVGSTIFLDSSGNNYDGSCSGTSCPLAGVAGQQDTAVQFDGSNDYFEVPHNPGFDFIESQGKVTIVAWVNINNWYSTWFPVMDKYESTDDFGWTFQINSNGNLNFVAYPAGISCYSPLGLHTWYHLAVSYDQPAGFIRFYVNGAQVCEKAFSAPLVDTQGEPLYVGYNPSGGDEYSNGIIDEVAIFSQALSAEEIASFYSYGYSGPPWLSVTPLSSTVPAGGDMNAYVRLDASDLSSGTYASNLSLNSNDPITSRVIVPVTLQLVLTSPEIPAGPDPQDDEVNVPVSQGLSWQASPLAEAYDLYLWNGGTQPGTPTVSDLSQASYDPPGNLLSGTTYHWQVIARNVAGSTPGPVWTFVTEQPTSVGLAGFSVTSLPQGAQLDWRSGQELLLLGFNLYRSETLDGLRILINPQMIFAINPGELPGNDYQYLDTTVEAGKAYYYWLEWVEKSRSEYYGPVNTGIVLYKLWLPLGVR